ncbi:hypothetical protein GCM10010961_44180 [Pseudodonghicola xiamenensis]|uniref:Uncharacterized protein n=1 Tax=Pseudodonghicola xiamenensis TaxID=337702 RepID=A0A8J3MEE6_9RHOB|nr:hypothetical protein GCM10010961_44180 [Pseudodonghicola xiamenensis]
MKGKETGGRQSLRGSSPRIAQTTEAQRKLLLPPDGQATDGYVAAPIDAPMSHISNASRQIARQRPARHAEATEDPGPEIVSGGDEGNTRPMRCVRGPSGQDCG